MSLEETSKKETINAGMSPLVVTIENPNTGETSVIKPNFFIGVYTKTDNVPEGSIGVGQVVKGSANTLDQLAIVKVLQEKIVPLILSNVSQSVGEAAKDSGNLRKEKSLLDILLNSSIFSDD